MEIEQESSTRLTAKECQELADAVFEDATALPLGPEKNEILKLAHGYRNLAKVKNWLIKSSLAVSLLDLLYTGLFDHARPKWCFIFYQVGELGRCIA
jgi:hypothetical protein